MYVYGSSSIPPIMPEDAVTLCNNPLGNAITASIRRADKLMSAGDMRACLPPRHMPREERAFAWVLRNSWSRYTRYKPTPGLLSWHQPNGVGCNLKWSRLLLVPGISHRNATS